MLLKSDLVRLPARFDAERLLSEIKSIAADKWLGPADSAPGVTVLPLIAECHGRLEPDEVLDECLYSKQVLSSFAAVLGPVRLERLNSGFCGYLRTDLSYESFQRVRVVLPTLVPEGTELRSGPVVTKIGPGQVWAVNSWVLHGLIKPENGEAIQLVFDTPGSAYFWDLLSRGLSAAGKEGRVRDRLIRFIESSQPQIKTEADWLPAVMPPAEQERMANFLLNDLALSEAERAHLVEEFADALERFRVAWRGLHAEYGANGEARSQFESLLTSFSEGLHRFEHRLTLSNGADAVEAVRSLLVTPALRLEPDAGEHVLARTVKTAQKKRQSPVRSAYDEIERNRAERPRWIERPVFIVAPPRSGTSLLFETLMLSPDFWTIGGESHALIEGIPSLHPAQRGFESNRLTAADADAETSALLEARFLTALRDRDGNPPPPHRFGFRLLEKTPKNALRVPFLNAVFPDAAYIYLYRDPRSCVSSMLDAWRSGRFVTYQQLPRWAGPPWSLALIPGWRSLSGHTLPEIVAEQWATTTRVLIDDLEHLPSSRWCVASYERLVADPQDEIERLCDFLGITWDRRLTAPLPLSRHTLTPPDPEKWKKNEAELNAILPLVRAVSERARAIFAHAPTPLPRPGLQPPAPSPGSELAAAGPKAAKTLKTEEKVRSFASVATDSFPYLLDQLGISLLVSTYQSGRVIVVRSRANRLNTHFSSFPSPMGIALGPRCLAIGTQQSVWEFRNVPAAGPKVDPPGEYDACFVPRAQRISGDIRIHEMAFLGEELWVVNTRFSCLCTLEADYSFVPRWRPPFVQVLDNQDRCHLNGLAVADGRIHYVTAHAETGTPQGWRDHKVDGGCLVQVDTGETVVRGLSMPHSPRIHQGTLWLLESGRGTLATVDLATGRLNQVAEFPGFTRGLSFAGPFAFVGLSKVRESVFGGIPLCERLNERVCGVWVVDLRNGRTVAFMRFEDAVEEIFDVQVLHDIRFPELAEPNTPICAGTYVLPDQALEEFRRTGSLTT